MNIKVVEKKDGHRLLFQFFSYSRKLNLKTQEEVKSIDSNILAEYLIKSVKNVTYMVYVIFIMMILKNSPKIVQKSFSQISLVGQIIKMMTT